MKTINNNLENELIVKNSRFITLLFKINSVDIDNYLEEVKKKYPKATHYCYAYIYDNFKYSSDDGEPTGTAGSPMLNVLEKENLNHILAITVRYFGGIKLGAGGLIRAYTKSLTDSLKSSKYLEMVEGYRVKFTFNYDNLKQIDYFLRNDNIIEKDFLKDIIYIADIPKDRIEDIPITSYEIISDIYIEKDS